MTSRFLRIWRDHIKPMWVCDLQAWAAERLRDLARRLEP